MKDLCLSQTFNVAIGYLPGVEGKFLLMKTPCTSDAGPEKSKLRLIWKTPPRGLAFMEPESIMQDSKVGI